MNTFVEIFWALHLLWEMVCPHFSKTTGGWHQRHLGKFGPGRFLVSTLDITGLRSKRPNKLPGVVYALEGDRERGRESMRLTWNSRKQNISIYIYIYTIISFGIWLLLLDLEVTTSLSNSQIGVLTAYVVETCSSTVHHNLISSLPLATCSTTLRVHRDTIKNNDDASLPWKRLNFQVFYGVHQFIKCGHPIISYSAGSDLANQLAMKVVELNDEYKAW